MGTLFFWPLLGALIGIAAAQRKGFSVAGGIIGGLLLGPFAIFMFFVSGVSRSDRNRRCPFCAEWIRAEAQVCKHCRTSLVSADGAAGARAAGAAGRSFSPPPRPKNYFWPGLAVFLLLLFGIPWGIVWFNSRSTPAEEPPLLQEPELVLAEAAPPVPEPTAPAVESMRREEKNRRIAELEAEVASLRQELTRSQSESSNYYDRHQACLARLQELRAPKREPRPLANRNRRAPTAEVQLSRRHDITRSGSAIRVRGTAATTSKQGHVAKLQVDLFDRGRRVSRKETSVQLVPGEAGVWEVFFDGAELSENLSVEVRAL